MKIIIAALLLTACMVAQSAKVVPVDSQTSAKLTTLAANVKEAQKAYDDAVEEAQHRLLTTRATTPPTSHGQSCFAYREGEAEWTAGTFITGSTYGGFYSIGSGCETPEEKAKRAEAEKEATAEKVKWEADHPSHYWLEGFCEGSEFTDDFRYLVPKSKPTVQPGIYWNGGGINPTLQGVIH